MESAPVPSDGDPQQAICAQIDLRESQISSYSTQIALLRLQICNLKSHLNATTTIGRLPVEVLAEIFSHRVAAWSRSHGNVTSIPQPDPWAGILHVCRLWRQVAFRSPRLWCTFPPTSPALVRACLANSGVLPLKILVKSTNTTDNFINECYEILLEHLARVRSMRVRLTPSLIQFFSQPRWSALEAPILEDLRLYGFSQDHELPAFITMSTPALRSLALTAGSNLSVHQAVRPTLTSLTLNGHYDMSPKQVLQILHSLPSLSRLALVRVCRIPWLTIPDQEDPIAAPTLPALEDIIMIDSLNGLVSVFILNNVTFPSAAHLRVRTFFATPFSEVRFIASSIRHRMALSPPTSSTRALPPPPIRSLRLECRRSSDVPTAEFVLSMWTKSMSPTTYVAEMWPEDAKCSLRIISDVPALGILVEELFKSADLGQVTTMVFINSFCEVPQDVWHMMFKALPKLHHLLLEEDAIHHFSRYHTTPFAFDPLQSATSTHIYPSLEILSLSGSTLVRCCGRSHPNDLIESLVPALENLKRQGLRLKRLELLGVSNVTDNAYRRLVASGCSEVTEIPEEGVETYSECSTDSHGLSDRDDEDEDDGDGEDDDEDGSDDRGDDDRELEEGAGAGDDEGDLDVSESTDEDTDDASATTSHTPNSP